MKKNILILIVFAICAVGYSRLMELWSYEKLQAFSELIIIAKPIANADVLADDKLPEGSDSDVVGVNTTLNIEAVLKGDKQLKSVILYHYRLKDETKMPSSGYGFVSFNLKKPYRYLLFLRRTHDGTYYPVSGQEDPAFSAIQRLENALN